MPYSSESGKAYVRNIVGRVKHERMLDIGCGSGTYAKMFPDAHWTGVEVWEPYIEEFKLKDLYQQLILSDAREIDLTQFDRFDVAMLGDVLEHMEKEEAKALFDRVREVADTVIVSIPIGYYPQDEYNGNPHERHVTDNWTDEDFRATFGEPTVGYIENEIGVYCWSNQKVRPKICIYAISKNEEQFVKRWADSAKDADLLLVADTGSSDNTVQECKENGVTVHDICITPWRFDHARNASLALIPRDMDICICLDLDEVMEPGWREEIERVWTPDTTHLRYKFDWSLGIVFYSEKIHARHGYHWHHPCHEHIRADLRITEVWANTDFLLVTHHPDPTKSRGHYMETLELSVKEDPHCPRNAFYYARELYFYRRWDEAIEALNRYLKMPEATWINDRCYAMRIIGECHNAKGDQALAESWYHKAAAEAPHTREPWMALAKLYYEQAKWPESFGAAMRALSIKNKELVYTTEPASWGALPHDHAAIAAWNLGLKEVAIEQGQIACDLDPDDQRLRENLLWYTGKKAA
jgi:glycosyltransferase involved in cell wall biosynthesis